MPAPRGPLSRRESMATPNSEQSNETAPWASKRDPSGRHLIRRSLPWLGLLAVALAHRLGLVAEAGDRGNRRGRPLAAHRPRFRGRENPRAQPLHRRRAGGRENAPRPAQTGRSGGSRQDPSHHHRAGRRTAARSPRPRAGRGGRFDARGVAQARPPNRSKRPAPHSNWPKPTATACAP